MVQLVKVERERVENDKFSLFKDEGPCFFKIFIIGSPTTKELRIPPRFTKHIKKEESNTATLQGPCGGHWRVKLGEKKNGTVLQNGWPEFIRDNSIREADFLLFTYKGNLCFNVQIFDKSGLERIDTSDAASSGVNKQRVGRPRKESIDHHLKLQQSTGSTNGTDGTGTPSDGIHEEASPAPVYHPQSDRTAKGKQQEVELSNGKGKRGRPRKYNVESLNLHLPESRRDDPGSIEDLEAEPSTGKRKPGRPRKYEVAPLNL